MYVVQELNAGPVASGSMISLRTTLETIKSSQHGLCSIFLL